MDMLPKLPLRAGTPEQFAPLRAFLGQAGDCQETLDFLLRLFRDGNSVDREAVERWIPNAVQRSFEALGLLGADSAGCYCPVALYPVRGIWIASDRWKNRQGDSVPMEQDFVIPATHRLTREFLDLLPESSCNKLLELCSGAAAAALLGAKSYARESWAADVSERATQFGEFNRLLNDLNNATVLQGNLYEPVTGLVFDRIVAHPPYVPTLEACAVHADGGEDGEFITRAIVEGLPRYLAPGGRFYCTTMGLDRDGEPYEQRVRQWLGAAESEFDVLFLGGSSQGPAQFAYRTARTKRGNWDLMDRWRAHLEKLKITRLVSGSLVIQRRECTRTVFTIRRQKGENGGASEAEWLLDWERRRAEPGAAERLLQSRLVASTGVEVHTIHAKRSDVFVPTKFTLKTRHPFHVEYECPAWVAKLVQHCDGKIAAQDLLEAGRLGQWIADSVSDEQVAHTLAHLVSVGILRDPVTYWYPEV